jgi:hypothetical protein
MVLMNILQAKDNKRRRINKANGVLSKFRRFG